MFISINKYCFLQNTKYLYRAARFIDWCLTTNRQNRVPDNPYSMFEGILYLSKMLLMVFILIVFDKISMELKKCFIVYYLSDLHTSELNFSDHT